MKYLLTAAAATLALSGGAGATTFTLDFSGPICGGPCWNGLEISQDYGDGPLVDVSHSRDANNPAAGGLLWWSSSYSDLTDVAYGLSTSGPASITLTPAAGYELTLLSFQLGAWPTTTRETALSIRDGLGAMLQDFGIQTILGSVASTFAGAWTSAEGVEIRWGPDSYYVGIDNITFSVTEAGTGGPTDPVPPVPLPASVLMLGAGLAGLGLLRRRRRGA